MEYLKVAEVAEKWNMSKRRVQDLCRMNMIPGSQRWGRDWMIPAEAERPIDGRCKAGKTANTSANASVLLRKSPFLSMTNLYNTPGTADQCIQALAQHPETQKFFMADIAYSRGQIDDVYLTARVFLDDHSNFYSMMAGGMLLGLVAMWKGDIKLWNEAHKHFLDAPCKNDEDRDIVTLALASTDLAIRDTTRFPDWFARGCFDRLHKDARPAAWVYYIKYLLIFAQECATTGNHRTKDMGRMGPIKMLPYIIEPMISQMVTENIVMAEIYLRLLAAIVYHQNGDDAQGGTHLDTAIRLCLADGLYSPLVEHRRQLGLFLDDHLARIDPQALKKVKMLHKQLHTGWVKLHNAVLERTVQETLTIRELEVAQLAAFGLSNQEIAKQLSVSTHTVRSLLDSARDKVGVDKRMDLSIHI